MTNPLITGAEVVADAVDLALYKERYRIAKLDPEWVALNAATPGGIQATEAHREQAVANMKERIKALLEWRP
jgi:hypothetical protein